MNWSRTSPQRSRRGDGSSALDPLQVDDREKSAASRWRPSRYRTSKKLPLRTRETTVWVRTDGAPNAEPADPAFDRAYTLSSTKAIVRRWHLVGRLEARRGACRALMRGSPAPLGARRAQVRPRIPLAVPAIVHLWSRLRAGSAASGRGSTRRARAPQREVTDRRWTTASAVARLEGRAERTCERRRARRRSRSPRRGAGAACLTSASDCHARAETPREAGTGARKGRWQS